MSAPPLCRCTAVALCSGADPATPYGQVALGGFGAVLRLPGPYTALACQVAGEITDVTDCSWKRTHKERKVHRQAGLLLGRLHERGQVPEAEPNVSRITGSVDGHLDQVGELLTSKQRALARDCVSRLAAHGPRIPVVASHGDFQPRNWLWDAASSQLGVIDWERAEPAGAICDLARLEYGPWDRRPDLREEFLAGYGRTLTAGEQEMLASPRRCAWP